MNQSRLAATIIGMVLVIAAIRVPPQPADRDPVVFHHALQLMRAGQGYYPAMDEALANRGIGPVSSARGFRSPWLFYFWRLLGGDRALWLAYLALAVVTFWLHAHWAAPYLQEQGREAPIWGWMVTSTSFPRFVGFGMPFPVLLGPLAAVAAWWQAWRRGWLPLVGPVLAFGFLGFAVERSYWGAIVTPLQALLATDLLLGALRRDPQ